MKKIILLAFLIGSAFLVSAQLTMSSSSQIVVASGSQLVVTDIVNTSGTITNSGTVNVKGDITNNTGGLFNNTSTGTVTFTGASAQTISGAATVHYYGTLDISNSSGGVSVTGAAQEVHGNMSLTSGTLSIGNSNLTLASTTALTGGSATSYIVTSGTGQLMRTVSSTDVLFPVGNSVYNPITLNNTGTSDIYGVKAVEARPTNFTGATHVVNESWDVTEAVGGGSDLTVTTQWNTGDEATFDRTNSSIGLTIDAGANVTWGSIGAATGSNPYVRSTTGITSVGTFMVADDYFKGYNLNLKVWLSGPYNTTSDDMDNDLNTAGGTLLIPLTDPYESTTTVASIHVEIIDWVKIELRASDRIALRKTYHAFVNTSGEIVDYSNSPFFVSEVDFSLTDYSVAIIHRNHFGVASSANDINLRTTTGSDFTQLANVYDNIAITNPPLPLDLLETGEYGLWAGDANDDGQVQYASGANSDQVTVLNAVGSTTPGYIVPRTYTDNDVNMDGDVQYASGANSDQVTILNAVGSTTPGNILSTHLPE